MVNTLSCNMMQIWKLIYGFIFIVLLTPKLWAMISSYVDIIDQSVYITFG